MDAVCGGWIHALRQPRHTVRACFVCICMYVCMYVCVCVGGGGGGGGMLCMYGGWIDISCVAVCVRGSNRSYIYSSHPPHPTPPHTISSHRLPPTTGCTRPSRPSSPTPSCPNSWSGRCEATHIYYMYILFRERETEAAGIMTQARGNKTRHPTLTDQRPPNNQTPTHDPPSNKTPTHDPPIHPPSPIPLPP